MHKLMKNAALSALSLSLLASFLTPTTSLAKEKEKEEVIYANLTSSGTVDGLYVVNIFDRNEARAITDFGNYTEIRNMNTTDTISYDANRHMVSIPANTGRLYYEGTLAPTALPWDIQIQYLLNGKELTAEELAGQTGALKITLHIGQNKAGQETFFENFALQTSLTLDTRKCKAIETEGATIANVGNNKQFTYTILPGTERDICLTAEVENFEMDSIAMNGVNLSLEIQPESIEKGSIQDKIEELQDAIKTLDKGANDLDDGTKSVTEGTDHLADGIRSMQTALSQLNQKSNTLTDGSTQMQAALKKLQTALNDMSVSSKDLTKLSKASSEIKAGIAALVHGLETMDNGIDTYQKGLKASNVSVDTLLKSNELVTRSLNQEIQVLSKSLKNDSLSEAQKKAINEQIDSYKLIVELLSGDSAVILASNQLIDQFDTALSKTNKKGILYGANTLKTNYNTFHSSIKTLVSTLKDTVTNMQKLRKAVNTLVKSYDDLDTGIEKYTDGVGKIVIAYDKIFEGAKDLATGTQDLYEGTNDLVEGTNEFAERTKNLDDEVDDEINSMIDAFANEDYKPVSFVSEENKNVNAVQFVIKTPTISIPEQTEVKAEPEKPKSFFEKLRQLF